MFINKSTFIFIILLSSISTITNYKCKEGDTEKNVEIGNEVILCLHSVNLQKKVAFKLKVDEYSVISIEDGFSKLVKSEEGSSNPTDNTDNSDDTHTTRRLIMSEDESPSGDESTEEIKEEFIGQIGNVRTKFPSVNNILYIILIILL